ncbi:hypothetical protein [Schaalia vaccimaxillae]|uniref:hypothetical protein n=1 Tax=Schaalia vaccimaxillae TaxID=183916 RepID=UPI0003B35069|nr:hypothetical protein [Schaalia vaccimaxillae]
MTAQAPHKQAVPNPPLPWGRLFFLIFAAVSLLMGLNAALVRLGALAPISSTDLGTIHGILMIYGFLGTAICLERAVALQSGSSRPRRWAYAAPLLSGAAGVGAVGVALNEGLRNTLAHLPIPQFVASHLTGFQPARMLPGFLWTLAMMVLIAIYIHVWNKRQQSIAVLVQGLGAFIGFGGALLWWRGLEVPQIVRWWLMFLVITIIGERLELARLNFLAAGTERRILTEVCGVILGLVAILIVPNVGYPILGLALGIMAIDTAWHDVARRTIKLPGLPRLAATCMLTGYSWALVPAIMWVVAPPTYDGYAYDTGVHALTIGFVVSMVLAHAPVIIPAVAKREVPFHPIAWLAFVFLEASLLLRIVAGVRQADGAWRLGGTLGVMGMLIFVVVTLTLTVRQARRVRSAVSLESPAKIDAVVPGEHDLPADDPQNSADVLPTVSTTVSKNAGEPQETAL